MSRRSEQRDRIEAAQARIEDAVAALAGHLSTEAAAIRLELRTTRSSAEAAQAGVQTLAGMLPAADPETPPRATGEAIDAMKRELEAITPAAPQPPSAVPPAAGGEAAGEPVTAARRAPKTLKQKDM